MIRPEPHNDSFYKTKRGHLVDYSEMRKVNISEQTLEAYEDVIDGDKSLRYRLRKFMRAENDAGRIAKVVKDLAVFFLPFGKKIETATDIIDHITQKDKPMIGSALKRAFSTDGGSWIRVRDQDGNIDTTAIIASIIRLALLAGVVYLSEQLGVTDTVLGIIGL